MCVTLEDNLLIPPPSYTLIKSKLPCQCHGLSEGPQQLSSGWLQVGVPGHKVVKPGSKDSATKYGKLELKLKFLHCFFFSYFCICFQVKSDFTGMRQRTSWSVGWCSYVLTTTATAALTELSNHMRNYQLHRQLDFIVNRCYIHDSWIIHQNINENHHLGRISKHSPIPLKVSLT